MRPKDVLKIIKDNINDDVENSRNDKNDNEEEENKYLNDKVKNVQTEQIISEVELKNIVEQNTPNEDAYKKYDVINIHLGADRL